MPATGLSRDGQKEWLDIDGRFLFGKHKGKKLETVIRDDMGYISWILNEVDNISGYDRKVIERSVELFR